jgi:hypothetical protein
MFAVYKHSHRAASIDAARIEALRSPATTAAKQQQQHQQSHTNADSDSTASTQQQQQQSTQLSSKED